ncbi:type II secretion system F family protein [Candidatus Venteria ishoeyi]|uniref:type II secretion system F family protein n=1 Tax=Candidatus Venteria ishoeyi TaxID=1899563 RepID=UPI0025A63343|nr:type II secretion system F family protein [Candidatus Venteria ishoeyi]MDM8545243.1 type II secretion system F family protein [Candidatus Venteria ishoeyi]
MAAQSYRYSACDAQGKKHQGTLNAETEQEAVAILQNQKLIPVQIQLDESAPSGGRSRSGIKNRDVIDFTNGLCTLVEAHVPLDKALSLLEGITSAAEMQNLINEMRREVKDGHSLADALQAHPQIFSRMYINMVHAGEEGGILEKLLPRLAKFLEDAEEARRTVMAALTYPLILLVVGVFSVAALLMLVVPQFTPLFEDMGDALPASAALLMGISDWLKHWWWTLLGLPFLLAYAWKQWGTSKSGRLQRDGFLLRIPLLGNLLLEAESSRFCRTLGALLQSGIPLLKSLHIARGVMENQMLSTNLESVEENVRSGAGLGKSLAQAGNFPVLLSQLVVVGEESGRTAEILNKLAESFDTNVRQQTSRLMSLIEPVLILVLGGMVGSVVIIIFSAIFSLNNVNF